MDPRENQKTDIVDDQWEISLTLIVAPADIALPWSRLPSGGAKAEQGDPLCLREDDISYFRAGKWFMAELVVALSIFVPKP